MGGGWEQQLGQVIPRLKQIGQGGGKEGKVWLLEADRAQMFTGVMRGKQ